MDGIASSVVGGEGIVEAVGRSRVHVGGRRGGHGGVRMLVYGTIEGEGARAGQDERQRMPRSAFVLFI